MLSYRSTANRLLLSALACLLLCTIISAEIPELLSLIDVTSDDFTLRKAERAENLHSLTVAAHKSVATSRPEFQESACACSVESRVIAEVIASDLFIVHSALRRYTVFPANP